MGEFGSFRSFTGGGRGGGGVNGSVKMYDGEWYFFSKSQYFVCKLAYTNQEYSEWLDTPLRFVNVTKLVFSWGPESNEK